MASAKERAWLSAHQKGSRALVQRLDKVHANNPEYQAFKKTHGLENTSSVKQVSKSTVDARKEKARQVLAGKAYGATKGTRMGSAEGTGETLRDTIAPLTRDQHSAVKAAEREAKAAEKPAAAPKKPAKPKKEKAPAPEKKKPSALELIAAAAAKRKINQPPVSAKALRRIAAVGDMEHDHGGFDDLGDTQYGGRGSYNEETIVEGGNYGKPYDNDADLKSKSNTELQSLHNFWKTRIEKDPNHSRAKGQLAKIKAILAGKIGKKTNEEVELDENDYSRRRKKEEEIISGKKPERKKIPMGSDYAARRRKERLANNGRMDEANYIATADSNPDMLAASRYGTTTTQAPKGTEKGYQKLLKRQIKNRIGLHKKPNLPEEAEQVDEMIPYALSAANYQAELRRQEKAKTEHQKTVKRKAKEQLDKDSEDTGNPFASWEKIHKESAPGWMLRQNPELAKKVKARIAIAKNRKKQMGNPEPVKEAKKHHMGGALFADTAARLQKAVNAHKERMNQIENGPEDTYHHAGLNLTTKSRVKLPAPWAKVEDK